MSGYNNELFMLLDISRNVSVEDLSYSWYATLHVSEVDREDGVLAAGPTQNYVKFDMSFSRFLDCIDTQNTDVSDEDVDVFKFVDNGTGQQGTSALDYGASSSDFDFVAVHMEKKVATVFGDSIDGLGAINITAHGLLANASDVEAEAGVDYTLNDLTIDVYSNDTTAVSAAALGAATAAESAKLVQWGHAASAITATKDDNLAAVDDIVWQVPGGADPTASMKQSGDDVLAATAEISFTAGSLDVSAHVNKLTITDTALTAYLQTLLEPVQGTTSPAIYDFANAADITNFRTLMETAKTEGRVHGLYDTNTLAVEIGSELNGQAGGSLSDANQNPLVWSMTALICFN